MSMASLVTSQCKSITCDFVTSSGSAFSAIDKGFANRIRQDIRRLGLGPSDMYYTVSYFGETNRDPVLCWKEDYPSILEVFEVTDQGVLAITPQRIKSQSLVGESIVAGLFQAASDVPDFRLMGSVNAVHAGDDRYSLSKMNGYQLSEWLRDNYSGGCYSYASSQNAKSPWRPSFLLHPVCPRLHLRRFLLRPPLCHTASVNTSARFPGP